MKTFYRGHVIITGRDGYGVYHRVDDHAFSLIKDAVSFINKKLEGDN